MKLPLRLRVFLILLLLMIVTASVALLTGCGYDDATGGKEGLSVVTTIFPPYDFVHQIAGEQAEVTMLLAPGSEMHSYEPSPQDLIRIQNCDVFVYVGGESDTWVPGVLDSIDTEDIQIVRLMDMVEPLDEESEGEYDEHIWTSPRNAALIVSGLTQTLIHADPTHENFFEANSKTYLEKLADLDQSFESMVQSAQRNTIVVADRFAHRYLTEAYGLEYFAAFPGCAEDTEPSVATVVELIDKVRAEHIPAVFYIEFSNQKMADSIKEAIGVKTLLLHSCHNVTRDEFQEGVTYLDLMERNLESLKEALN